MYICGERKTESRVKIPSVRGGRVDDGCFPAYIVSVWRPFHPSPVTLQQVFGTRPTTATAIMILSLFGAGALVALTSSIANAQFPPKPEGLKVLESRFGDGVQISYKEVSHSPCVPFLPRPHHNGKHGRLNVQNGIAMHINSWYMEALFSISCGKGRSITNVSWKFPHER